MKEVTRKAEMKAREQRLTAYRKFTPLFMSEHLANDGFAVTVDKAQILITKQDEASFVCILNQVYGWDYTGNFKDITLYFETTGNRLLYVGVYDLAQQKRITKRAIAAERWSDLTAPYTYGKEEMEAIFDRMRTAPQYRPF